MPFRKGQSGNPKGWKKGRPRQKTIAKEAAKEALRQIVLKHMEDMTAAQIDNAKGIKFLVARNKATGKFERLAAADLALKGESDREVIEVYEKDPSVQAFTDLMNRAIGKPAEEVDANIKGDFLVRWASE